MSKDVSYKTVHYVLDSWEEARRLPGFEEKFGTLVMQKLFELEPRTKSVFGFKKDDTSSPEDSEYKGDLSHAMRMMNMFDAAMSMLGPDTETLREILQEVGQRHIGYGVKPHYFPFMGHALVHALSETLGDSWSDTIQDAWVEIYDLLSGEMMKSILNGPATSDVARKAVKASI